MTDPTMRKKEALESLRAGDLRYVGQGYELRVPFAAGTVDDAAMADVFAAFQDIHRAEYGHVFADSPVEIVNIRLTGVGAMPKIGKLATSNGDSLESAILETRRDLEHL